MLVGILAGDDLRLSEIDVLVSGLTAAYGQHSHLELGTVNDEATFSGRLSVVVLLFEEGAMAANAAHPSNSNDGKSGERATNTRFRRAEKTMWQDEDLDVPTYLRRQLTLDR